MFFDKLLFFRRHRYFLFRRHRNLHFHVLGCYQPRLCERNPFTGVVSKPSLGRGLARVGSPNVVEHAQTYHV